MYGGISVHFCLRAAKMKISTLSETVTNTQGHCSGSKFGRFVLQLLESRVSGEV